MRSGRDSDPGWETGGRRKDPGGLPRRVKGPWSRSPLPLPSSLRSDPSAPTGLATKTQRPEPLKGLRASRRMDHSLTTTDGCVLRTDTSLEGRVGTGTVTVRRERGLSGSQVLSLSVRPPTGGGGVGGGLGPRNVPRRPLSSGSLDSNRGRKSVPRTPT